MDHDNIEVSDAGAERLARLADGLTDDQVDALLGAAEAREDGSISRREFAKAAGALGVGSLLGGGGVGAMTETAAADASTTDGDWNVGGPNNRGDIFADGLDATSVSTGSINNVEMPVVGDETDIQSACDDAGQDSAVELKAGTYTINAPVNPKDHQTIKGHGGGTILKVADGTTIDGVFKRTTPKEISIKNVHFDINERNSSSARGVYYTSSFLCEIIDCYFYNGGSQPFVHLVGSDGTNYQYGDVIRGCTFHEHSGGSEYQIHLADDKEYSYIHDNRLQEFDYGIKLENANHSIQNNIIHGELGTSTHGIYIVGSASNYGKCLVANNIVNHINGGLGMIFRDTNRLVVSNNILLAHDLHGIVLDGVRKSLFQGNEIGQISQAAANSYHCIELRNTGSTNSELNVITGNFAGTYGADLGKAVREDDGTQGSGSVSGNLIAANFTNGESTTGYTINSIRHRPNYKWDGTNSVWESVPDVKPEEFSSSRSFGTAYTNNNGVPMHLTVVVSVSDSTAGDGSVDLYLTVSGSAQLPRVAQASVSDGDHFTLRALVPPGDDYTINNNSGASVTLKRVFEQ